MSDQNKDRLEEFFNKATQNYHFEYREEDWNKLKEKLDQAEGSGAAPYWKRNGRKLMLSAIILIVSLLALFFILDTKEAIVNSNAEPLVNDQIIGDSNVNDTKDNMNASLNSTTSNNKVLNSEKERVTNNQIDKDINGVNESKSTTESSVESITETGSEDESLQSSHSDLNKRQSGKFLHGMNSFEDAGPGSGFISGEGNTDRANYFIPFLNPKGLSAEPYQFTIPEWTGDIRHSELQDDKEDVLFSPNLSFALIVAPDFSTVGIGNFSKPGTRIGGILSYDFHRKWSFRAGAIMTKNIYKAKGDQYSMPKNWYNMPKPISANGNCEIMDIPISLRYNYLLKSRNTFYLAAGFNSYIMLSEEYDFEYEYPQPYDMSHWESSEVTEHMFGLINISAGWEHHLAPRWSFQAEPFINIPVSGIGWGEVDLYTIGSYFSLKYQLYRK